jgi:hypothetical protein
MGGWGGRDQDKGHAAPPIGQPPVRGPEGSDRPKVGPGLRTRRHLWIGGYRAQRFSLMLSPTDTVRLNCRWNLIRGSPTGSLSPLPQPPASYLPTFNASITCVLLTFEPAGRLYRLNGRGAPIRSSAAPHFPSTKPNQGFPSVQVPNEASPEERKADRWGAGAGPSGAPGLGVGCAGVE